jgi:hypothetical protein
MNDDQITLINIATGNQFSVFCSDPRFEQFKKFVAAGEYDKAEAMDTKVIMSKISFASSSGKVGITINNGIGKITFQNSFKSYDLADAIVAKAIKMSTEGFDTAPLVNFIENLYQNPSKTAIDELFLFLEQSELPITPDGHFIAYKIVRNDYLDIYSVKFDNSVGAVCEMERFEVDDKRTNTCSSGLHFCSKGYLPHYGQTNDSRCMLVKINPADVVSIPNDYNNAKGRTCKYEVVGEVNNVEWRKQLESEDFTTKSVVNYDATEYYEEDFDQDLDETDESYDNDKYWFDDSVGCWRNETGHFVKKVIVASYFGIDVSELDSMK